MSLRGWGIALLVVGIVVIGTGIFAAVSGRELWKDSEARCAGNASGTCGAGESLAAAFLFVLGPVGVMIGTLLMLAGGILVAIGRRVERGIAAVKERAFAALVSVLE